MGGGVLSLRVVSSGGGVREGVAGWCCGDTDVVGDAVGGDSGLLKPLALCRPGGVTFPGGCELASGLVQQWHEPVRDHAARRGRGRLDFVLSLLLSECAALRDGGSVGSVDGDDGVEDVACFGEIVAVGDDTELVALASAGGCDVHAAAGGRRGDERDGGGDSVGLVAVLGGCVAEPNALSDVVGRQGDGAVSALMGHGDGDRCPGCGPVPRMR